MSPPTTEHCSRLDVGTERDRTPVDILMAARELISTPATWTQGTNARTALGSSVPYDHPTAVCFCLYGAVCRVGSADEVGDAWEYLESLIEQGGAFETVSEFNDCSAHSDVLHLIDDAIDLAKAVSP